MKKNWSCIVALAIYLSLGSNLGVHDQGAIDEDLEWVNEHSTPFGQYEYYKQVKLGKPLWQKGCIVWHSNNGKTHRFDFCEKAFKIGAAPTIDFDYWYPFEGLYYPVKVQCRSPNFSSGVQEFYFGNKVLDTCIYLRYQDHQHKIWVNAFLPNPIHASSLVYGKDVSDNFDANSSELENQLQRTYLEMDTILDSKGFSLAEVVFRNLSAPNIDERIEFGESLFSRNDSKFELWHILFHLNHFATYLKTSNYAHLIAPVQIDPHALNGADKSAFNSLRTPPSIEFGIGGVDDAEDAQVIIHEYVHALAHQASPFSYSTTVQKAIEEAIADYFALYYSYLISGLVRREIYTWDGHNEFWEGVTARSNLEVKSDAMIQSFDDRSRWLCAYYSCAQHIGFEACAGMLLEFLHQNRPLNSNADAANQMLNLSDDLYGQEVRGELANVLSSLKFIEPTVLGAERIRKLYVQGNILRVQLEEEHGISSYRIRLYKPSGELLEERVQFEPEIEIDFKGHRVGIYPIRIEMNQSEATRNKELFLLIIRTDLN
jgi:hypothetical protein